MIRAELKKAREKAGLTQDSLASRLDISSRYYRMIERGERDGDCSMWDSLEDLFGIHQRILRHVTADEIVNRNME